MKTMEEIKEKKKKMQNETVEEIKMEREKIKNNNNHAVVDASLIYVGYIAALNWVLDNDDG